jgi:hypothetical protein
MRIIERFKRGETPQPHLPRASSPEAFGSRPPEFAAPPSAVGIRKPHNFGHSDSAQTIPMRSGLR